jgi:hypothetical protein
LGIKGYPATYSEEMRYWQARRGITHRCAWPL